MTKMVTKSSMSILVSVSSKSPNPQRRQLNLERRGGIGRAGGQLNTAGLSRHIAMHRAVAKVTQAR